MAEYINKEEAQKAINDIMSDSTILHKFRALRKRINNIPTADVVEVVRCKDCKHYKPYAKPVEDFDGKCIVRECEIDENEFCSYGTPKERGGEK